MWFFGSNELKNRFNLSDFQQVIFAVPQNHLAQPVELQGFLPHNPQAPLVDLCARFMTVYKGWQEDSVGNSIKPIEEPQLVA